MDAATKERRQGNTVKHVVHNDFQPIVCGIAEGIGVRFKQVTTMLDHSRSTFDHLKTKRGVPDSRPDAS